MADAELAPSRETDLRPLAQAVLDHVRPRVHSADLCIETIAKTEYSRLAGGQEVVRPFVEKGAMQLRVIGAGGRCLTISVGLLPFESLRPQLDQALALLDAQDENPRFGLAPVPNKERVRYGLVPKVQIQSGELLPWFEALAREVMAQAQNAAGAHSGIDVDMEVICWSQIEEKIVADTTGLYKTQVLPQTFLQVTAKARDVASGRITQQRQRIGDIKPLTYLFGPAGHLRPDFAEAVGGCARRAIALQRARRLSREELARVTHYVLASSAMVFVHEAEGHNFEADIIKDGGSGLFKMDGSPSVQPLGSACVDVYDGPVHLPGGGWDVDAGFGTHHIDDEGVEVQPVRLVEKGRIVAKLHNRETAHHYGEAPNGRGFSELGDKRLVRMTNTYLYPAEGAPWFDSLEELVKDVPFGVWLEGSMGGAVSKEGMSTTIQFGRLIKDGKLTDDVLLPSNLTVRTQGSLRGIEGFAGPLRCDDPGFCGKGQTKTVTDGGPMTKIRASDAITLGF